MDTKTGARALDFINERRYPKKEQFARAPLMLAHALCFIVMFPKVHPVPLSVCVLMSYLILSLLFVVPLTSDFVCVLWQGKSLGGYGFTTGGCSGKLSVRITLVFVLLVSLPLQAIASDPWWPAVYTAGVSLLPIVDGPLSVAQWFVINRSPQIYHLLESWRYLVTSHGHAPVTEDASDPSSSNLDADANKSWVAPPTWVVWTWSLLFAQLLAYFALRRWDRRRPDVPGTTNVNINFGSTWFRKMFTSRATDLNSDHTTTQTVRLIRTEDGFTSPADVVALNEKLSLMGDKISELTNGFKSVIVSQNEKLESLEKVQEATDQRFQDTIHKALSTQGDMVSSLHADLQVLQGELRSRADRSETSSTGSSEAFNSVAPLPPKSFESRAVRRKPRVFAPLRTSSPHGLSHSRAARCCQSGSCDHLVTRTVSASDGSTPTDDRHLSDVASSASVRQQVLDDAGTSGVSGATHVTLNPQTGQGSQTLNLPTQFYPGGVIPPVTSAPVAAEPPTPDDPLAKTAATPEVYSLTPRATLAPKAYIGAGAAVLPTRVTPPRTPPQQVPDIQTLAPAGPDPGAAPAPSSQPATQPNGPTSAAPAPSDGAAAGAGASVPTSDPRSLTQVRAELPYKPLGKPFEEYCCMCHEWIYIGYEDNPSDCPFWFCGYADMRGTRCAHRLCESCGLDLCDQQGVTGDQATQDDLSQLPWCDCANCPHPPRPQPDGLGGPPPPVDPGLPSNPASANSAGFAEGLASALGQVFALLLSKISTPSDKEKILRQTMKNSVTVSPPTASAKDLRDLEAWNVYFKRQCRTLAGGGDMLVSEQIIFLIQAWENVSEPAVGPALKLLQKHTTYQEFEAVQNHTKCYELLFQKILNYRVAPELAKKQVKIEFDGLGWKQNDTWQSFWERWEASIHDMQKYCPELLPPDATMLQKVLDVLPSSLSRHFVEMHGSTLAYSNLKEHMKRYQEIQELYPDNGRGGILTGYSQTRAIWDQTAHHMNSPLGKNQSHGGRESGEKSCPKCHGTGHMAKQCPNLAAARDAKWTSKKDDEKKATCTICLGQGHQQHHHHMLVQNAFKDGQAKLKGSPPAKAEGQPLTTPQQDYPRCNSCSSYFNQKTKGCLHQCRQR